MPQADVNLSPKCHHCSDVSTLMQIGIDSFISTLGHASTARATPQKLMGNLLDRIAFADEMGLDVFGIGEHLECPIFCAVG